MKIRENIFGHTSRNEEVKQFIIENEQGASLQLISYGAAIQSIIIPDQNGQMKDVVLGYDSIEQYEELGEYYFGATIGRVANRIENSSFLLNGKKYTLPSNQGKGNCLHGGIRGFDKRNWESKIAGNRALFSYFSSDGEEGFPGALKVTVSYEFTSNNQVIIDEYAVSDSDTIINLTNHSYFNLTSHSNGSINDHYLQILADYFAESDEECLTTGNFINVERTPFDFRKIRRIGDVIDVNHRQQLLVGGYDHSFCIQGYNGMVRQAAKVCSKESGIVMRVLTNKPAIHFYSGNFMKQMPGKQGTSYRYRGGFCLETQYLPNAMKQTRFPSIILRKGDEYMFRTIYAFSIDD